MRDIFFIIHGFSGAKTYSAHLLRELRKSPALRVCEVFLGEQDVSEFTVYDLSKESASGEGLRILFPKKILTNKSLEDTEAWLPEYYLLRSFMIEGRPVIFHFNNEAQLKLAEKIRLLPDVKIVFTCHFLTSDYTWCYLSRKDRKGHILPFSQMLYTSDRIICVTEFARQVLSKEVPETSLTVIYNGFEGSKGRHIPDLRARYGFSSEDVLLLFVGRVTKEKGIPELFSAFDHIADMNPHVRLIVAGQGDIAQMLNYVHRHHSRITFMGNISGKCLRELYGMADVGVVPSLFEQCSYVVLEMMRHSLPLVATEIPGLSEIACNGQNALTVPVRPRKGKTLKIDESVLAETLICLVENPSLRRSLGMKGEMMWRTRFRRKEMASRTLLLYQTLFSDTINS